MKPTTQAIRAIGVEFIRRRLRPLIIVGFSVATLLAVIGVWLVVTVSIWWWLVLAPVLMASLMFMLLVVVAGVIVRSADSAQNREQKRAVRKYVDALQRVAENIQTPPIVIMFRVVSDVVRPRPDGFITTMSHDSRTMAPELKKLIDLFRNTTDST